MTKIINLFGAPGSGKSTVASGLFYELKLKGYNCEMASEWVKAKVFEGTPYPFKDQFYASAKQNKKINEMIGKVDYVITDAPLLMGLIYSENEPDIFNKLLVQYHNRYDNVNFLLDRSHKYHKEGRFQTEEQSDELAILIKEKLEENNIDYITLKSTDAVNRIIQILNILGIIKK